MAAHCAWCSGTDLMAGADLSQCPDCGKFTTADGAKALPTSESNEGAVLDTEPKTKAKVK